MRFVIYPDVSGQFRWRLVAGNNRIVADSGEAYVSASNAERAVQTIQNFCADIGLAKVERKGDLRRSFKVTYDEIDDDRVIGVMLDRIARQKGNRRV